MSINRGKKRRKNDLCPNQNYFIPTEIENTWKVALSALKIKKTFVDK